MESSANDKRDEEAKMLAEVIGELYSAKGAYQRADHRYRDASKDHTSALNRLNDAQKRFDAVVADMKKAAPRDSDWQQRKAMRHE